MPRFNTVFICQDCAYKSSKWLGKCPKCDSWNSFLEEKREKEIQRLGAKKASIGQAQKLLKLTDLSAKNNKRISTKISELDRVLGGGLISGSLILLAGDPGIGKSTLSTQLLSKLGGVYVCAEESPQQIKLRFKRLKLVGENVFFINDNNIDNALVTLNTIIKTKRPKLLIIDSIQTVFTGLIRSSTGSASQIRECSNLLLQFAKKNDITVVIVGHITKEGAIAGPKILEHLVDVVLYLSGDKNHQFRLLAGVKNRFGATDEVGIFDMSDSGLNSISDPSQIFGRDLDNDPGACLTVLMQGTRPLLVEVQALCVSSKLAIPRRVAQGINISKLQVISAVLQKQLNLPLYNFDIFLSVAGGLRVVEPAVDLAIAAAIFSSVKNKKIKKRTIFFGELGLLGDIRKVSFAQKRNKEAKSFKFNRIISHETGFFRLKQALREAIS